MLPCAAPSHAADRAIQITPYLWAAGLRGDISPFKRTPTVTIKKPFLDIMGDLDFAGFLNLWGRYGNFVLSGDMMYVSITDGRTIGPVPPSPLPLSPGTIIEGEADTRQFTASLQGGYRFLNRKNYTLDMLAGFNYWYIYNALTFRAGPYVFQHDEHFSWVDPMIGARGFIQLNDQFSLQAQANIGGFDIGSKLTWSLLASVNYIITDSLSASAGYKMLDVEYSDRGYVYDTRLSGTVMGMTWRF